MSFAFKTVQVKKSFQTRLVFEQLSAEIAHGEKVALVGPNGVGKTTLLQIITGALPADEGAVVWNPDISRERIGLLTQQAVFAEGETVWEFVRRARSTLIELEQGMRNIEERLAEPVASQEIDQWMQQYGVMQQSYEELGGYGYDHQVKRVLEEVGLAEEVWQTEALSVSGGQKTRAQLARLLLQSPQVLLLDEPTNHLDAETMDWLERMIRQFVGTVVIVSHDRYFLDRVATRVLELRADGIGSYPGNYTAYRAAKELERRTQQMAYRKQQAEIKALEEAIQRFRRWYDLAHDAAGKSPGRRAAAKVHIRRMWNKQKQLDRVLERKVSLPQEASSASIHFEESGRLGNRVFLLEDVAVRFGERCLYQGVHVGIERGQRIGLIGPNGIGKSTLLKVLTGELAPTEGVVKHGPSVRIGYFGQEVDKLDPDKTILDEMMAIEGLRESEARLVLAGFLFRGEAVFRKIGSLSQGEKCRVAFVKMYFSNSNVLVLDEPTNYLDIQTRERVEEALLHYPGTLLLVSHDRFMMNKLATQLLLFEPGKVTHYPDTMQAWTEHREKSKRTPAQVQREERKLLLQMELSRLVDRLHDPQVPHEERARIREQMDDVQAGLQSI